MIRRAIFPSVSTGSITTCATTTAFYVQQRQYTHFGPVRRPAFQSRSRGVESGDGRGATTTTPVSMMNDKTSNHSINSNNNHTAVFNSYQQPSFSSPTTPYYTTPYPPHTVQQHKGVSYPSSHPHHQPATYPYHHRTSTPTTSGHPHYTAARGSAPPPKDGAVKEPSLPAKSSSATTKSTPPMKQQVTSTPPSSSSKTNSTGINGQGSHRQRTPPTSSPPAFLREGTRAFASPYLVGLSTFLCRFLPVDRIRKALTKAGVSERVVSAAGRGWFGIAIDILPLLFSFLLIPEGLRRAQAISLRHRIADGHPPIAANAQPPNSPKNAAFPTTKKDDEDDEKRSSK